MPRAEQDLLPAKTSRGQGTHPGSDRLGKEEGQRPVGDATRRHLLRGPNAPSRLKKDLTTTSGYVAVSVWASVTGSALRAMLLFAVNTL